MVKKNVKVSVSVVPEPSKKYKLNKEDLLKLGKGFLIALAGSALVFVSEFITQVDFGEYTFIVLPISAVLVNAARKFLIGKQ